MKYLIDFLEQEDILKSDVCQYLKCNHNEAMILRLITKEYMLGLVECSVNRSEERRVGKEC